jgi:Rps23 Pro-64 3,4-dihydroxylase Tpa1-like proline 4-hydroxylase
MVFHCSNFTFYCKFLGLNYIMESFSKDLFPIFIKDNYFTEHEEKIIWNGFKSMHKSNLFLSPNESISASKDGVSIKKNSSFFVGLKDINDFYIKRFYNTVLKVFSETIYEYSNINIHTNSILKTTNNTVLVSYYDNGDFYPTHRDVSLFTILMWFYREPKAFLGGDLFLDDINEKIEVKNNRIFIMPSHALHSVSEVVMDTKNQNNNNNNMGRYSVTIFLSK